MVDKILLQRGDLSEKSFKNNGTNNNGGISVAVSEGEGNLLQERDDGLYYGITAPANLQVQYVDAIGGIDAEGRGSRDAPVKTLNYAVNRLPSGTLGNYIFLKENQVHEVHNPTWFTTYDKSIELNRYGDITDSIEAAWNSNTTGWTSCAAAESKASEPILMVIPDYIIPAWPDKYCPTVGKLEHGHLLTMRGIKIGANFAGRPSVATSSWPWSSIFFGDGRIRVVECTILNAGAAGTWHFVNSHDANLSIHYLNTTLTSDSPDDYVTGVFPAITAVIEARDNGGAQHPSGLHWSTVTTAAVIKNSQRGALAPTTVIPNYTTNI